MSRRHFLKHSAQAAAGLGAVSLLGGVASAGTETKQPAKGQIPAEYQPMWVSWVAATAGCLNALGVACDAVDVAGHTGYAFLLNTGDKTCVSGPTAFDWGLLLPGIAGLGRSTLVFRGRHCPCQFKDAVSPSLIRDELRAAYDLAAREVEAGRPCVLWGGYEPEFCIVVGVDGGRYLLSSSQHAMGEEERPVPLDALKDPSGAYVLAFPSATMTPPAEADRNALLRALVMLNLRPSDPLYSNGQAAYDRWIAALEAGNADPFGNSYNAQCWSEMRDAAQAFTGRLAARNPHVQAPLARAAAAFTEVRRATAEVAKLFPFPDSEKRVGDPKARAQAVDALRAARKAEAEATAALADAAAAWPAPTAEEVKVSLLAPCGLDCAQCDVLKRGECVGCRGDRRKQWSGDCTIRACATDSKHLTLCNLCDQFVCQKLKDWGAAYPHHAAAVKRLEEMKGKRG